ncbi:MAG: prenyltransferase [Thaumarchaeota archaeon]|nr:prenyltransferase [Nitrososphaerota archaeon]
MADRSLGGRFGLFFRFARVQFLPLVLAPILVGTASAWHLSRSINPQLFLLLLAGAACLQIASNSIDDVYDFLNGVDRVSETMFPKEFPGWKPIPRGLMSVSQGLSISLVFYSLSLAIGLYLAVTVGWIALAIAIPGVLLSYFYVAPPLKLDYRGLGLGEVAIFLGFGPLPVLGAFYVLTGTLSWFALLASIPSGLLTVDVLLNHDMIFYDAYKAAAKKSMTVVLGRVRTESLTFGLSVVPYLFVAGLVLARAIPFTCLLVLVALPFVVRGNLPARTERPMPEYGSRTRRAFFHSVVFSLLLAVGLFL